MGITFWHFMAGAAVISIAGCSSVDSETGERLQTTPYGLVVNVEIGTDELSSYRMIVDTGAAASVLNLAGNIPDGARLVQDVNVSGSTGSRSRAGIYRATRFSVANTEFENFDFVAIDLSEAPGPFQDGIDGILGPQGVMPGFIEIDFSERRLVYHSEVEPEWGEAIHMSASNLPMINLSVAGTPMTAVIDSGASGFLTLPESMAASLPLEEGMNSSSRLATVNGTSTARAAHLQGDIAFLGQSLSQPEIVFSPDVDVPLLGLEALRQIRIIFDSSNNRFWIMATSAQ